MSIRKVFWGCTLMAVLGAVGMYLAADHASRHHDSFLGRWMTGIYTTVHEGNPFMTLGAGIAGPTIAQVRNEGCTSSCTAVEVQAAPQAAGEEASEPVARLGRIIINEEEEIRAAGLLLPPVDAVEFSGAAVELIPAPTLVEEPTYFLPFEEFGIELGSLPNGLFPRGELVPAPTTEGQPTYTTIEITRWLDGPIEEVPAIMPKADDDAPAIMPPAKDDEEVVDFISFWKKLFGKDKGPVDCCKDKDKEEESEAPKGSQPPDCREDPHMHLQYPGCPHPHYICPQQRYYCPHSGRAIIPAPEMERRSNYEPVKQQSKSSRTYNSLRDSEECEICSKHREIDTMEFRPSDARPDEFGLMPF